MHITIQPILFLFQCFLPTKFDVQIKRVSSMMVIFKNIVDYSLCTHLRLFVLPPPPPPPLCNKRHEPIKKIHRSYSIHSLIYNFNPIANKVSITPLSSVRLMLSATMAVLDINFQLLDKSIFIEGVGASKKYLGETIQEH